MNVELVERSFKVPEASSRLFHSSFSMLFRGVMDIIATVAQ